MKLSYVLRLRCAAVSVLLSALLSITCAVTATATPLVITDSSWRVTPTDPGAVPWNTSPSFDDSAWQNATVIGVAGSPFIAQVIWSSGGQFSTTETQIWARHTFSLANTLSSALLTVGCDDDCDVWVNGVQVISDHNGFANNSSADILAYLTLGENLIAFTVSDNFEVFGFNHGGWLQIDATVVPEPPPITLLALAAFLAAPWCQRRRH